MSLLPPLPHPASSPVDTENKNSRRRGRYRKGGLVPLTNEVRRREARTTTTNDMSSGASADIVTSGSVKNGRSWKTMMAHSVDAANAVVRGEGYPLPPPFPPPRLRKNGAQKALKRAECRRPRAPSLP